MDDEKRIAKKTNHINIYDYYSSLYNITFKTIHVNTEFRDQEIVKYLTTKEFQFNPEFNRQTNQNLLVLIDKNIYESKFQKSFIVIKNIGSGSYGSVFKVKERSTEDLFAIKKIEIKGHINCIDILNNEFYLFFR